VYTLVASYSFCTATRKPVSPWSAASADERSVQRRFQRNQIRGNRQQRGRHGRPGVDWTILEWGHSELLERDLADVVDSPKLDDRENRPFVCSANPESGGWGNRLLRRQVSIQSLAARHRHSGCRYRRQP